MRATSGVSRLLVALGLLLREPSPLQTWRGKIELGTNATLRAMLSFRVVLVPK